MKLNNSSSHCETYWSLLKTLTSGRRMPHILPIQIGDVFITSFTEKVMPFTDYFAKQCRVIDNNSQLSDLICCANFCRNERINNIKFAIVDILKIYKFK